MSTAVEIKAANRRKSPRRKVRTSVKLECRKGSYGLGPSVTKTVLDLSDTGVQLIVSKELTVLGEVEVLISGYGMSQNIKRVATVRWQVRLEDGSFCVGIEFQKRLNYRDWQIIAAPNG